MPTGLRRRGSNAVSREAKAAVRAVEEEETSWDRMPDTEPILEEHRRARPVIASHHTVIDGKLYDLSGFMEHHPGGSDLLMLAGGRDATVLFHSYHRNLEKASRVLEGLEVTDEALVASFRPVEPVQSGLFAEVGKDGKETFFAEVRRRVNAYFAERGLSSRGGWFMVLKSMFLLGVIGLTTYVAFVRGLLWLSPLVGVLMAMLGLAIQHDANHGALSASPTLNTLFGFCDDVIGGSALCWRHQHMVAHHADPNHAVLDADTYMSFPLLRMNPALPRKSFQTWQWLYAWPLYTLIGMSYTFGDFAVVLSGSYAHVQLHELRPRDWAQFVVGKLLHFAIFWALPVFHFGLHGFLFGVLPAQLCGGLFLATTFAVSHNSEGAEYNLDPSSADWGELQTRTAVNWSVLGDPETPTFWAYVWLFLVGGLNYQIEHHLFPGVAHIHYPAISTIVRDVCRKRNVPYNAHPSFASIVASHAKLLYLLGNGQDQQVRDAKPRII